MSDFIQMSHGKGDRILVEIEFTKDIELVADRSILLKSMYGKQEINGEFKVTALHFHSHKEFKQLVIEALTKTIERL